MISGDNYQNKFFRGAKEILYILLLVTFIVLLCALWSHNPDDNNFSPNMTDSARISNAVGYIGARISDNLLQWFGKCAYILPFLLFYIGCKIISSKTPLLKINFALVSVRIIGFNLIILSLCALATQVNFLQNDEFDGGGHLGGMCYEKLYAFMGYDGAILAYLAALAIGFQMAACFSWISVCGVIGSVILAVFDPRGSYRYIVDVFKGGSAYGDNAGDSHRNEPDNEYDDGDFSINIVDIAGDDNGDYSEDSAVSSGNTGFSADDISTDVNDDRFNNTAATINKRDSDSLAVPDELVDFGRPNVIRKNNSEDLTIPGLGSANPDVASAAARPVNRTVDGRVEPTIDLSSVDSVISPSAPTGNVNQSAVSAAVAAGQHAFTGDSGTADSRLSATENSSAGAASSFGTAQPAFNSDAGMNSYSQMSTSAAPETAFQSSADGERRMGTGKFSEYYAPDPSPIDTPPATAGVSGSGRTAQGEPVYAAEQSGENKYVNAYVLPPHDAAQDDALKTSAETAASRFNDDGNSSSAASYTGDSSIGTDSQTGFGYTASMPQMRNETETDSLNVNDIEMDGLRSDDPVYTGFNSDEEGSSIMRHSADDERVHAPAQQTASYSRNSPDSSPDGYSDRVEPHFSGFDNGADNLKNAIHNASEGDGGYINDSDLSALGFDVSRDNDAETLRDREAASGNIIDFASIHQNVAQDDFSPIPPGFTLVNEENKPAADGSNYVYSKGVMNTDSRNPAGNNAFERFRTGADYNGSVQSRGDYPADNGRRAFTGSDVRGGAASAGGISNQLSGEQSVARNADGARFVSHDDLPDAIRYTEGHYEYDSKEQLSTFPSTAIFKAPSAQKNLSEQEIMAMITRLDNALEQYRIEAHVAEETVVDQYGQTKRVKLYKAGPVVTRFFIDLGTTPLNKIQRISTDLARSLLVQSARVIPTIPGTAYVGIEIPNAVRNNVNMRELLESDAFANAKGNLVVCLGKDVEGAPVIYDLAKAPHLLVAGTTGSGKSVGINTMLVSLLMKNTPDKLRLIMVDPKILEFSVYRDIPHLLTPVITDMSKVMGVLQWACDEMDHRYSLLDKLGVRNINNFNEIIRGKLEQGIEIKDPLWRPTDSMDIEAPVLKELPFILIVIDEFADLVMQKSKQRVELESLVARLAQKARACGIHLILATQSPRKEVITGIIKSNFPSQISFKVKSYMESRIIIDEGGAESLLGRGDMLIKFNDGTNVTRRAHGAFISDEEVNAFAEAWRARGKPEYVELINNYGSEEDSTVSAGSSAVSGGGASSSDNALYDSVVEFCCELKKANKSFSVSSIQRHFTIGYNRASRIAERLEENGIISAPVGKNGIREILIDF